MVCTTSTNIVSANRKLIIGYIRWNEISHPSTFLLRRNAGHETEDAQSALQILI